MLYIVRHAEAVNAEDDAARALSARGREQAHRMAAFLGHAGIPAPAEIWHSPLLRARETAEIVAADLGWTAARKIVPGLLPDDPAELVAKALAERANVAVFGHNPHVSLLATLLVAGRVVPAAFSFGKGSALALEPASGRKPGGWAVQWYLEPELLG